MGLVLFSQAEDGIRELVRSRGLGDVYKRQDHNRALSQLAGKCSAHVNDIRRMTIWGNHSSTQYPDLANCTVGGKPATGLVEESWYRDTFIPTVQQPPLIQI